MNDMHTTLPARVSAATNRYRERRTASKLEELDHENRQLKTDLRSALTELDRERDERGDLLRTIEKHDGKRKRFPIVRLLLVGGAAYVMGAKAGRDRYDQIMARFRSMREGANETLGASSSPMSTAPATSRLDATGSV